MRLIWINNIAHCGKFKIYRGMKHGVMRYSFDPIDKSLFTFEKEATIIKFLTV